MSAHSDHTGSGAIFAALGANLGIAVLKFIAYLLTPFILNVGRGYSLGGRLG